ncbi:hydroxyisourate hydrolase [Demequina capsici]|uniref:5-hydroxyisourate hydrolase n=1 Tax=Demequina capsici TaxID=3075620 RepID=A0AA96JA35_9MICO|nr:hydroxyisourate hydrolase [Demequina sp. PMTSA13]WNM26548.1 hydroxyisourate hydrolase [Demequina sp. PMTSA13]
MSHVTTHVLDALAGTPARGIAVTLSRRGAEGWEPVAQGLTDADGRVRDLGPELLEKGVYQVRFETGIYFATRQVATFYPEVEIAFEVKGAEHCHVPLLLSPFAYSTYRGS